MKDEQAVRPRYLIGNWKCNKTLPQALSWFDEFIRLYQADPSIEIVIAPPVVILAQLAEHLKGLEAAGISLAVQDISPFPPGSYTGAVAADMLNDIADYAILGHSERRRYFHETSQDVTNKVSEAADSRIKPIVCVDKTYAMSQLTSLLDIDSEHLVIAYCPVDSMNYRAPEPVEMVAEAAQFIGTIYPNRPIVYGGAINARSAGQYAAIKGIEGLFVGSASLEPRSFIDVFHAMSTSVHRDKTS